MLLKHCMFLNVLCHLRFGCYLLSNRKILFFPIRVISCQTHPQPVSKKKKSKQLKQCCYHQKTNSCPYTNSSTFNLFVQEAEGHSGMSTEVLLFMESTLDSLLLQSKCLNYINNFWITKDPIKFHKRWLSRKRTRKKMNFEEKVESTRRFQEGNQLHLHLKIKPRRTRLSLPPLPCSSLPTLLARPSPPSLSFSVPLSGLAALFGDLIRINCFNFFRSHLFFLF